MRDRRENESSGLLSIVRKYIDLKVEYYQLSFAEKVSVLVGKIALLIFTSVLLLAFLLLFILLVYNLLMDWIGIGWVVALIEIGFVLFLLAIMWIFRQKLIINPVANSIIKSLLESDDNDKEEENEEQ